MGMGMDPKETNNNSRNYQLLLVCKVKVTLKMETI